MDMDDDFIGEIEFNLSAEQGELVNRAIELASKSPGEEAGGEFARINPLIAIMRWWQIHVPDYEKSRGSPESTLVDACRRFLLAHQPGQT